MRCVLVIVLLLVVAPPARADEWTMRDTAVELVFAGTLAVDYSQTVNALQSTRFQEANPILGTRPSTPTLLGYNAACLALHAGIAALLPRPYREVWQALGIGVEVAAIGHNLSVGARLALP